jgi:hypothetical protein
MFVARHQQTGELFISIAGTNPLSAYAWLAEDFDVAQTRAWGYGEATEGVATSKATLTGLRALQSMVPPPGLPGENRTLVKFPEAHFKAQSERVTVTVSGHSLGGALSPTLALWLLDTQMEWDHKTRAIISVYAYAGPSPGNEDFAAYIEDRFSDRLHRIFNPLDVVTHAWNVADLVELKALYTPDIPRDAHWDKATDFLIATTNGISYRQIDPRAVPLNGMVKQELVLRWIPTQVNLVGQGQTRRGADRCHSVDAFRAHRCDLEKAVRAGALHRSRAHRALGFGGGRRPVELPAGGGAKRQF